MYKNNSGFGAQSKSLFLYLNSGLIRMVRVSKFDNILIRDRWIQKILR